MDEKDKKEGNHLDFLAQYARIEDPAIKKSIADSIAHSVVKEKQSVFHEKIRAKVFGEFVPNAPFAIDSSLLENKQSFEIHEEVTAQSFAEITRLKGEVESQKSQLSDKYKFDEEDKKAREIIEGNVTTLKEQLKSRTSEYEKTVKDSQDAIRTDWHNQSAMKAYIDVIQSDFPQYESDPILQSALQHYTPTLINKIMSKFDIIPKKVESPFGIDMIEYSFIEKENNPLGEPFYAEFDENGVPENRPVKSFRELIPSFLPENLQKLRFAESPTNGAESQPRGNSNQAPNNSGFPQFKAQKDMDTWLNENVDSKNTLPRKNAKKAILRHYMNTNGAVMP